VRVVLFEGCFLRWSDQIFVLHLKTDELLQFLLLSQALDINLSEERGEKGKSYFMKHIVITLAGIAVMLLSGVRSPARLDLPLSDPNLSKQPVV